MCCQSSVRCGCANFHDRPHNLRGDRRANDDVVNAAHPALGHESDDRSYKVGHCIKVAAAVDVQMRILQDSWKPDVDS